MARLVARTQKIGKKEDPMRQISQEQYVLLELCELFDEAKKMGINNENDLGLLLIGGLAVGNIAGPHRYTGDIDVIVRQDRYGAFQALLHKQGYMTKEGRFKGISASKVYDEHTNPVVVPLTVCVDEVFDMSSKMIYRIQESFKAPHVGRVQCHWDESMIVDGIPGLNARELMILKLMTDENQREKDLVDIGYLANTRMFKHLTEEDAKAIAELCYGYSPELAHHVALKITKKFLANAGQSFAHIYKQWFASAIANFTNVRELVKDQRKADELQAVSAWLPTVKMLDTKIRKYNDMGSLYDDLEQRNALLAFLGAIQVEILNICAREANKESADKLRQQIRKLPETMAGEGSQDQQGEGPASSEGSKQ